MDLFLRAYPCVNRKVIADPQDFWVMTRVIPPVIYHTNSDFLTLTKSDRWTHRKPKRELVTAETLRVLLGTSLVGFRMGVTSLVISKPPLMI